MAIIYGIHTCLNVNFRAVLWAQVIQSTLSTTRHSEVSCARFWSIIVEWAIDKLKIPMMTYALLSTVSTFHTIGIIVANNSKFSFVGSIPKAMFRDVPTASKILEGFRKLAPSGFRTVTPEMQPILAEVDKPKKGGKKGKKKGEKKKGVQEGPSTQAQTPTKQKR